VRFVTNVPQYLCAWSIATAGTASGPAARGIPQRSSWQRNRFGCFKVNLGALLRLPIAATSRIESSAPIVGHRCLRGARLDHSISESKLQVSMILVGSIRRQMFGFQVLNRGTVWPRTCQSSPKIGRACPMPNLRSTGRAGTRLGCGDRLRRAG
jgi:hypothetical protein